MRLLPKQEKFYAFFLEQSNCIQRAADLLLAGARANGAELARQAIEIKTIEEEGDGLIHEILDKLNHTFITPLDPEDIHRLAGAMDDVLDAIEEAAHRLAAHGLEPIPPEVVRLAEMVVKSCKQLQLAVGALAKETSSLAFCIEVNRLENEADAFYRGAVRDLFRSEQDAIMLIRKKEVLDLLEDAMDRVEDVADVIENVAVKNA